MYLDDELYDCCFTCRYCLYDREEDIHWCVKNELRVEPDDPPCDWHLG